MHADAIAKIENLTMMATAVLEAPRNDLSGRYWIRNAQDGSLTEYRRELAPISTAQYSTESLARTIHDSHAPAEVFYSPERITALLTDSTGPTEHRSRHVIRLEHHPVFQRAQALRRPEQMTQKQLIRLLRSEFNGHVDDRVIEQFRALKLTTAGEGKTVVAQGREGVDRSIQQEIATERGEVIPDEITIEVPVFDLDEVRDATHPIRILVDVSPDDDGRPVFLLTAVHTDLANAASQALDDVVQNLRNALSNLIFDDSVPLYYGQIE